MNKQELLKQLKELQDELSVAQENGCDEGYPEDQDAYHEYLKDLEQDINDVQTHLVEIENETIHQRQS
jgi:hypothetical protein